jgi:enoyl-CoA hydratase
VPRPLSTERLGDVELVTLERPEKRNALSIELRVELADAFGRLSDDAGVGCVVLTGAGTAFCSGMDVTQFGGDPTTGARWSRRAPGRSTPSPAASAR